MFKTTQISSYRMTLPEHYYVEMPLVKDLIKILHQAIPPVNNKYFLKAPEKLHKSGGRSVIKNLGE
ncbi:hypothetical protein AKJ58_01575 [candidate division MSBL1 archaeon SCGC-AAA385D11]|uniref:Uncharacterized protein n=1 Tax=candidate division MSBL1 archaeon SCGC-AAA385D11 TaxID=1698286 RepID=A0A133VN80_9EURY|nr:hypothetical protein AKJ58_01575 [candidate division MSBL1 archaeon SCGC-AAA385D11]